MSLWAMALNNMAKLSPKEIIDKFMKHPIIYKDIDDGIKSFKLDNVLKSFQNDAESLSQM